jgi:N-terminal acetyltransferase B complex catalytic subunit
MQLAHSFLADMRKAMPRDVHKKSVIPLKRPVKPSELDDD